MYPTLNTERLLLRPLQNSDLDDMYALYASPAVAPMMWYWDSVDDFVKYEKVFQSLVSSDDIFTVRLKGNNRFIGYFQLHQYVKKSKVSYSQINTAILPEYRNCGYCTEATKKVLHFAFSDVKTPWLCANQFQDNPAAGTVLKNCGLRFYTTYETKNRLYDQYRYKKENYFNDSGLSQDEEKIKEYVFPIKKSPYSSQNPIRRIDSIEYIKEPTGYLCGQSVVAMLAGVSVDEVIEVMETDKGTDTPTIRDALKWYGLKTATKARLKYNPGTALPECCILSVLLPGYGHWSLYYKGKFYDPEFGVLDKLPEQAKLRYYWEVVI